MTISHARKAIPQGYKRDYYGGALMALIGTGAAWQGLQYPVGNLTQMGPGFFPTALGVILVIIGCAIAGSAKRQPVGLAIPEETQGAEGAPEWRGWICILSSVAAFAIIGRWGGLLPATFTTVFISALGDRANTWRSALLLAGVISLVCVVVFWWALQMQFPLFTWG